MTLSAIMSTSTITPNSSVASSEAPNASTTNQASNAATTTTSQDSSSTTNGTTATSASLYVGELLPEITEAVLFEIFSQVGPVSSIRVCRDAITRRSLGYAYVNFHIPADAERAIEALNYAEIRGRSCRIMWSQRDPSLRRSGLGNVFIKNLDKGIDHKALYDTFSSFGHILSCKIAVDQTGQSRGFGFVHFQTAEAAELAIEKVNGMQINGERVFVGPHISGRERRSKLEELKAQYTNIFVKNLDDTVIDEELRILFSPYGSIQSAVVQRDESGKSKGFGFVNYDSHEAAESAVQALNETEFKGKMVFVGRAQKKSERIDELRRQFESLKLERMNKFHGVNLYVKNLDEGVTEDQLKLEFAPFGTITSLRIMSDEKTGVSKGFGFVCYSSPEESARAISELNGHMVNGKPLYVALAQRKEERRAQLEAQFAQRQQQARIQAMAAAGMTGMNIYQQGPLFYPPAITNAPQMRNGPTGSGPNAPGGNFGPFGMVRPPMAAPGGMRSMRPMRTGGPVGSGFRSGPNNHHSNNANQGNAVSGDSIQGIPQQQQQQQRRPYNPNYGPRYNSGGVQRGSGGSLGPRPQFYPQGGHAFGSMPPQPPPMMASQMGYAAANMQLPPLTAASLAAAAPEQQKRILGDRLYPLVFTLDNQHASKITGMLLEMDNGELLHLLESPEALTSKVGEAQEVLRQHQQQAAAVSATVAGGVAK